VTGEPNSVETDLEVAIACVGLLAGTAFIAYFTSSLVAIVTSLNQAQEAALQKLNQVGEFLADARLPTELTDRVLSHLQTVPQPAPTRHLSLHLDSI